MFDIVRLSDVRRRAASPVYFTKPELNLLLSLYSRRVIGGEWKDYAIDQGRGMSAFSIFRNSTTRPAYTVFKFAPGSHRLGDYVLGSGGNLIKRGRTLAEVLSAFERRLKLVSS